MKKQKHGEVIQVYITSKWHKQDLNADDLAPESMLLIHSLLSAPADRLSYVIKKQKKM